MSEAPALRIVPGAPPPAPLTKSQKKKRRAANTQSKGDEHDIESPITNGHGLNSALDSALVETAPATSELNPSLVSKPEDVTNAAIASDIAADVLSPTALLQLPSKKTSAIVEVVNKRHRTLHKKIVSGTHGRIACCDASSSCEDHMLKPHCSNGSRNTPPNLPQASTKIKSVRLQPYPNSRLVPGRSRRFARLSRYAVNPPLLKLSLTFCTLGSRS